MHAWASCLIDCVGRFFRSNSRSKTPQINALIPKIVCHTDVTFVMQPRWPWPRSQALKTAAEEQPCQKHAPWTDRSKFWALSASKSCGTTASSLVNTFKYCSDWNVKSWGRTIVDIMISTQKIVAATLALVALTGTPPLRILESFSTR